MIVLARDANDRLGNSLQLIPGVGLGPGGVIQRPGDVAMGYAIASARQQFGLIGIPDADLFESFAVAFYGYRCVDEWASVVARFNDSMFGLHAAQLQR